MTRATLAAVVATALAFLGGERRAAAGEFGLSLEGGYFGLTNAPKSAKAVFGGTTGGATGGGSIRYVFLRSLFVGAGAHYFERKGERVFVADANGTPFRLGHPLTLREVPVYGMVGWRFYPDSRLIPYVAIGAGRTSIFERSVVGGIEEWEKRWQSSYHALGGAEWGRGILRVGAELMYTAIPDSIGIAGVSKIYGEKDLGGVSIVGKIVIVP
jgi:hypothetical protein